MLTKRLFDHLEDGRAVHCYRLTNAVGAYVEILDYGCIIRAVCVPDRNGALTDTVLGYDTVQEYITNGGSVGATLGRCANRIKNAAFTLNGVHYPLLANNNGNHLHGGKERFGVKIWQVVTETENSITLTYTSPHMEEGYPGTLKTSVTYTWTDANALAIRYEATTDQDTIYNPSNHAYFNLNGDGAGTIAENQIRVHAHTFCPVDQNGMCIGTVKPVTKALDLRTWRNLGEILAREQDDPDLQLGGGLDHNYILRDTVADQPCLAAEVYGPHTGIRLRTYTTSVGVQVYTGNFLKDGVPGKNGSRYNRRGGVCLETQYFPDAIHHPEWPSPILRAGETAVYETVYAYDTPKQIVILDGYTTNPGDLSWAPLDDCGIVTVYDRTPPAEILTRAAEADILITNKTVLTKDILQALPRVRYIGLLSTGTNAVDLKAAKELGIAVTNVPGYSTEDVAQMTFAMMLELCLHVGDHSQSVHRGDWTKSKDFCYWNSPLMELAGKTLGIVGFGAIGQRVCEIARAFRMQVLVCTRTPKPLPAGAQAVSFEDLLAQSDFVSLHCPLTDKNAGMIDRMAFSRMKPTAFLINTARGGLICEADLREALNSGRIAGCALDVLSQEPPQADHPLLGAKNCIITPHIAWAAKDARARLIGIVAENIRAFLAGERYHRVD